jgi:hypothetical protein
MAVVIKEWAGDSGGGAKVFDVSLRLAGRRLRMRLRLKTLRGRCGVI